MKINPYERLKSLKLVWLYSVSGIYTCVGGGSLKRIILEKRCSGAGNLPTLDCVSKFLVALLESFMPSARHHVCKNSRKLPEVTLLNIKH